ncbi:MAG: peptidase domain-containing ABC transporter [Cytophagales bacterium]|nr:MAG: peptidase domain-containing ABC transporter [Cytophagales bacterium]
MKNPQKSFTLQHDQSDCGVACLLSIIRYYGGEESLENLRTLSGTDTQGTSLMGLYEAASKLGFAAKGCLMDVPTLAQQTTPVILHVLIEERLQHYVVCYGCPTPNLSKGEGVKFLIGDPAKGMVEYSAEELEKIWQSKRCLTLSPNENFITTNTQNQNKRNYLLALLKEDYPILLISSILGVMMAVLGMVMAVFSQKLIDDILPSKSIDKLVLGVVLVALLLVARVGFATLRQFLLYKQSRDFNERIGTTFYERLLHLPKSFFDTRKTGDLVARLNDTRRIQMVISELAGTLLADLLTVLISMGFLFSYSWQLGLLVLLSLPVYFYLVYRYNYQIINTQKEVMLAYAHNEGNYINTLQGIGIVKSYNRQDFFGKINQAIYGNWQEKIFQLGKINTRLSLIVGISSVLFLVVLLAFTAWQSYQNLLSVGEMMAVVGIASSLLPLVAKLALINIPLNEAKVAFDRMYEYANIKAEKNQTNNPSNGQAAINIESLKVSNLYFRFAGRKPIFTDVSFEVKKNEIASIVGESGTGKSTISQILERFYEHEKGEILINRNLNLKEIDLQLWRSLLGVVPQQIHIFNGTVLDNICLENPHHHIEKVMIFLNEYGFIPFIESIPHGLNTIIGESGAKLSGGQKQLLALARVLYKKPQLLILDEATSALDNKNEKFVLQLLEKIKPHTAIIFISHKISIVSQISDSVYSLENGRLKLIKHTALMSY